MTSYSRTASLPFEDIGRALPLLPSFLRRRAGRVAQTAILTGVAAAGVATVGAIAVTATVAAVRRARRTQLRGKKVLVTGSSRGLGLAIAEEFARMGARVVLTARDSAELERGGEWLLESGIVEDPKDLLTVTADLRRPEEVDYLMHRVTQAWGPIDILVNNAGIITVGPVENQTVEDFQNVMQTNFFCSVHCTLAALPGMLERRRGVVVNIASIGGKVAVPHLLPYTASKFAAVGFSEGLHAEMRGKGIHVLTVCPGLMRTGSHLNALFSGDAEREYRWFAFGATTPGISTSARHAARRIVKAVLHRETEIFITPQAAVMGRLAQVAPGTTAFGMSMVNRMLPSPSAAGPQSAPGHAVRGREPIVASTEGWQAAQRYNQVGTS